MREQIHVEITCADVPRACSQILDSNIRMYDVTYSDVLKARFYVDRFQYNKLNVLCQKQGVDLVKIGRRGADPGSFVRHFVRPFFWGVFLIVIFLTLWIPKRILFVEVIGNESIPTHQILSVFENCGIFYGTKRSQIRSEEIKNKVLLLLPELQWVGINTKGCVAEIYVKEKRLEQIDKNIFASESIVSSNDAIISSITVTSGTAGVSVGNVVMCGEILIHGYRTVGDVIQKTVASGEIYGQTKYDRDVKIPITYSRISSEENVVANYSLIIGKKRINLLKGSGISYTGCDKIYSRYDLSLPGGFKLPVAFVKEKIIMYNECSFEIDQDFANTRLLDYSNHLMLSQMVSGQIVSNRFVPLITENYYGCKIVYICEEMIGRSKTKEKPEYGEDN